MSSVPDARSTAAWEFAGGVMVFPGGGVDGHRDRRRHRLARSGPGLSRAGPVHGIESGPGRGTLWCARRRETFEESRRAVRRTGRRQYGIVADASIYAATRPRRTGRRSLSFSDFLRGPEKLVLRADLPAAVGELGDPRGGAHPPLRHLLLRRRAARTASGPTARTTESGPRGRGQPAGGARGLRRRVARSCCRRPGRQLDSLAGRAPSPRSWPCERQISAGAAQHDCATA